MTFKQEFLKVSLNTERKKQNRKDLMSPLVINKAMCYRGYDLWCITDFGIIQFGHLNTFERVSGKIEGLRVTCSMINHDNDMLYIVEDANSRTCSLRSEEFKWIHKF